MIEPDAHHELYESPGREPDQVEQNWLRVSRTSRTGSEPNRRSLRSSGRGVPPPPEVPCAFRSAQEGNHGLLRVQESGRSF